MHYKDGREARVGDFVFGRDWAGMPVSGVVVRTVPGTQTCNLQIVPAGGNLPTYNSAEFLHADNALELNARAAAIPPPPPKPQPVETPPDAVPETAEQLRLKAAEEAVAYALHRIREEPAIYWHCGDGSQLFDLLTASRALSEGETQDTIKEQSRPRPDKMQAWAAERERQETVMQHLDEQLRCEKGGDDADDYDRLTIRIGKFRNKED